MKIYLEKLERVTGKGWGRKPGEAGRRTHEDAPAPSLSHRAFLRRQSWRPGTAAPPRCVILPGHPGVRIMKNNPGTQPDPLANQPAFSLCRVGTGPLALLSGNQGGCAINATGLKRRAIATISWSTGPAASFHLTGAPRGGILPLNAIIKMCGRRPGLPWHNRQRLAYAAQEAQCSGLFSRVL